jgi:hypothetical protein
VFALAALHRSGELHAPWRAATLRAHVTLAENSNVQGAAETSRTGHRADMNNEQIMIRNETH